MQALKLNLTNVNNRLFCDGFTQIHFYPDKPLTESDMNRVYCVRVNEQDVFLSMVDHVKLPFKSIGSVLTLPSTGKESDEWRRDWLKQYPATTDETMMIVYMYKRLKSDI